MNKFFNTKINPFNKKEEGFTIVELLVVIAIIAVLTAIALPFLFNNTTNAAKATVKSDVKNSVTAITAALVEDSTLGTEALKAEAVITGDNQILVGGSGYDFTVTGSSTDPRLSDWGYTYADGVYSETEGNGNDGGGEGVDDYFIDSNGVTVKCPGVNVGESFTLNETTYVKVSREMIEEDTSIAETSCTTGITDMSYLFYNKTTFDGDISHWDTSSVTNMGGMFGVETGATSVFNQPIGNWDVSNVEYMGYMFSEAASFNQDISGWDVSKVEYMGYMFFRASSFNQPIGRWNVSNVWDMTAMFYNTSVGFPFPPTAPSSFNQDLSGWCVSIIAEKPFMFDDSADAWTLPKPVWGSCPAP
jgi:prepilin-type N-terminal cleavage/methylation domain-containing protein